MAPGSRRDRGPAAQAKSRGNPPFGFRLTCQGPVPRYSCCGGLKARSMTESILAVEPTIRLGFFLGIFAVMAVWEAVMPRRARTVSRWTRWPNNLGIVAVNTLLLRVLVPTAAVGLALSGEERGWGLLNTLA